MQVYSSDFFTATLFLVKMTPGSAGEGDAANHCQCQYWTFTWPPFHFSSHLPICIHAIRILGLSLYGQEFYKLSFQTTLLQMIFPSGSFSSNICNFLLQITFLQIIVTDNLFYQVVFQIFFKINQSFVQIVVSSTSSANCSTKQTLYKLFFRIFLSCNFFRF